MENIKLLLNVMILSIHCWLKSMDLELPDHKIEAVLVRKKIETITLRVSDYDINSAPSVSTSICVLLVKRWDLWIHDRHFLMDNIEVPGHNGKDFW